MDKDPNLARFLKKGGTGALIVIAAFLMFFVAGNAYALVANQLNLERTFTLSGDVTFIYDREWGSSMNTISRFSEGLNLGLTGFIVDPRLAIFQVNGSIFHTDDNVSNDTTAYGFGINLQLLNQKPTKGILSSVPQPITLRYSYNKGEDISTYNYGISLRYDPPPFMKTTTVLVPREKPGGKENNTDSDNGSAPEANKANDEKEMEAVVRKTPFLQLPPLFLDYDHYSFDLGYRTIKTDHLSLRTYGRSGRIDYSAEYQFYNYGGEGSGKNQSLQAEVDYHLGNVKKGTSFDVYNHLTLTDFQGERAMNFTNRTIWEKRFGPAQRDSLIVYGAADYFSSNKSREAYALALNTTYNKTVSERLANTAALGVGYGKQNDTETLAGDISDQVTYRLTERTTFSGSARSGLTGDGLFWNFSAGLSSSLSRMLSMGTSYSVGRTNLSDGPITTQLISLDLGGSVLRNLSFSSQNFYKFTVSNRLTSPYNEKELSLQTNILWRVWRFDVNFGINNLYLRKETPYDESRSTINTYTATITTFLARRTYLYIYSYYQDDKELGTDTYYFNPSLQWFYRKVSVHADYSMKVTKWHGQAVGQNLKDHRFFLRVSRSLDSRLRPWW